MSLDLDETQLLLRDNVRRFLQTEVVPLIQRHEAARSFPFQLMPKLAELGFLGGTLPEEEGGQGIDHPTWAVMMEELGYTWLSLRTMVNITNGSIHRLAVHGTPDQKRR